MNNYDGMSISINPRWKKIVSMVTLATFLFQTSFSVYAFNTINLYEKIQSTYSQSQKNSILEAIELLRYANVSSSVTGDDFLRVLHGNPLYDQYTTDSGYDVASYIADSGASTASDVDIDFESYVNVLQLMGQEVGQGSDIAPIGSAFVQGRLVRHQIMELLGRHLINPENFVFDPAVFGLVLSR